MFNYPIDWGATGTWALVIVGISGLIFAWKQIENSRELRKNEITLNFISRFSGMETAGVFSTAIQSLQNIDYSKLKEYKEAHPGIQPAAIYFLELSYYYHNDLINKELLIGVFPIRFVQIFDNFKTLIEHQRKEAPNSYLGWEVMIKDMRKIVEAIQNQNQIIL